MPRGRRPDGEKALSNAERQARHRANRLTTPVEVITKPRRPTDRRSRPQRWRDAVEELLDLQATYADWLETLPDSLRTSRMAKRSRPWSISTSPTWRSANHPAAMAATRERPPTQRAIA